MKRSLILILLALALSLSACMLDEDPEPTEVIPSQTEQPTEAPTEKPTEAPTEAPTEKPTEAPTEKPTEKPTEAPTEKPTEKPTEPDASISATVDTAFSTDKEINGTTFSYAIPRVSFNGVPDEKINAQIWQELYTDGYEARVESALKSNTEPELASLFYDWNISNGILSIMCKADSYYSSETFYSIYNILIREKRMATRDEVIAAFGMDKWDFHDLCVNILGTHFWNDFDEFRTLNAGDAERMAEHDTLLWQTVEDGNISQCIPFVGPGGGLFVLGKVATPAGAGYYYVMSPSDMMINTEFYARVPNN